MYSKLWSANMAQRIKFNLIHKSLHSVLLRLETTRNFPPKDDIRIMVNLRQFWNSNIREVSRTCYVQHYASNLTFKVWVPTFSSAWKNFSKVISQLFWWILSFKSIIFRYFSPKRRPFLKILPLAESDEMQISHSWGNKMQAWEQLCTCDSRLHVLRDFLMFNYFEEFFEMMSR